MSSNTRNHVVAPADETPRPAHPSDLKRLFGQFDLDEEALRELPPIDVLLADKEAGARLRQAGRRDWLVRAAVFAAAAMAVLLAIRGDWRMFRFWRYTPTALMETEKPLASGVVPPEAFREAVADIEQDIGERHWVSVHAKLLQLRERMKTPGVEASPEFNDWVLTESLVALASRDADDGPAPTLASAREMYKELTASAASRGRTLPPYRAMAAYASVLALAKSAGAAPDAGRELIALLSRMRGEYGNEMDKDRGMLLIEARSHIAALPKEYAEDDPGLREHWEKSARAVARYRALAGDRDPAYVEMELARWSVIKDNYFSRFTRGSWLITRREIRIGDESITAEQAERNIEKFTADRQKF